MFKRVRKVEQKSVIANEWNFLTIMYHEDKQKTSVKMHPSSDTKTLIANFEKGEIMKEVFFFKMVLMAKSGVCQYLAADKYEWRALL